jgi:hypothetical protein
MRTLEGWVALVLGIFFLLTGIGGGVKFRFGQLAISGLLGAVLIILALVAL